MSKDKFKAVRDAFLELIADATDFSIDYDADTNDLGRMIDCSTYHIKGNLSSLKYLCEKLDVKYNEMDESLDTAIQRAIEES